MLAGLGSPTHILLVLLVVLLLFGAKRLPEMGRSLGQGIQEFKEGLSSKDEPPEEKRPEAVEGKRADANPAGENGHHDEETARAKDPESSKRR